MKNGDDHNSTVAGMVEKRIRKPSEKNSAEAPMNERER